MYDMKIHRMICLLGALSLAACADDDSSAEDVGATETEGDDDDDDDDTTTNGMGESTGTMGGGGSGDSDSGGMDSTTAGGDDDDDDDDTTAGTDSGGSDTAGSDDMGDDDDDDDNGSSSDGMMVEQCEAPGELVTCDAWGDDIEWYNALGLGCEGGPNEAIPVMGTGFNSPDSIAWNLSRQFGSYEIMPGEPIWAPTEGEQFLILSSGNAGNPDADGVVLDAGGGSNGNPDNKAPCRRR